MPKAAIDMGGATQVLPLDAIAEYVQALVAAKGRP
jgi:chemotaxis response regulator CheB